MFRGSTERDIVCNEKKEEELKRLQMKATIRANNGKQKMKLQIAPNVCSKKNSTTRRVIS
jgi:hypothetical protein